MSELCSEPIRTDIPPWKVFLIHGVNELGDPTSWLMIRAHHLLVDDLSIHDLFITKYPNPWSQNYHGNDNLCKSRETGDWVSMLTAPSASLELFYVSFRAILQWLCLPVTTVRDIIKFKYNRIINRICDIKNSFTRALFYEILFIKRQRSFLLMILQFSDFLCNFPFKFYQQLVIIAKVLNLHQLNLIRNTIRLNFLSHCLFIVKWIISWFYCGYVGIRSVDDEYKELVRRSFLEIYWLIRAAVSLPRLILEEILIVYKTEPIPVWNRKAKNAPTNKIHILWSEGVPLSCVSGVKGMTGASLSSVLLTATTGAVRDLVRACGTSPPDKIQCTLPLYTPVSGEGFSYGLLPLALPTGCPTANSTLRSLRVSLEKMRKYPERYLASIWLTRHVMDFLPR